MMDQEPAVHMHHHIAELQQPGLVGMSNGVSLFKVVVHYVGITPL